MKRISIRDFFKKVPLQQKAVADRAGIDPRLLNNFVKGVRDPKPEHVEAINKGIDKLENELSKLRVK